MAEFIYFREAREYIREIERYSPRPEPSTKLKAPLSGKGRQLTFLTGSKRPILLKKSTRPG